MTWFGSNTTMNLGTTAIWHCKCHSLSTLFDVLLFLFCHIVMSYSSYSFHRNLKAEIEELQRARDAEIDFGLEGNACSLCMVEFGTFFGRGAPCPWCRRKVCTTCRLCAYVQQKRSWMCTLCAKEWQLRKFSGDWMEVGRKHRVSNSSTALFVLKSIMRMPCKLPPNQLKRPFLEDCSSKSSNSKRSPGLAKDGSAAEGERGNAAHVSI